MSSAPFQIRDPKGDDLNLVLNSWLRSARDLGDHRFMSQATYYGAVRDECIAKLKAGFVVVACDREDPDHIYGWACAQDGALHFVYVKQSYRNRGIAKALVKEACPDWGAGKVVVTTAGRFHREWAGKYGLDYNPFSWKPPAT